MFFVVYLVRFSYFLKKFGDNEIIISGLEKDCFLIGLLYGVFFDFFFEFYSSRF